MQACGDYGNVVRQTERSWIDIIQGLSVQWKQQELQYLAVPSRLIQ